MTRAFDESELQRCFSEAADRIERSWRLSVDATLKAMTPSTAPQEGFKALNRLLSRLVRHMKICCEGHSRYYWFYHLRREVPYQLAFSKAMDDHPSPATGVAGSDMGRVLSFKWLYRRACLACLRFGTKRTDDVIIGPPRMPGTTGYSVSSGFESNDLINLWTLLGLVRRFEYARVCQKRMGKGGWFAWIDQDLRAFEVELEGDLEQAVEVYDQRFTSDPNLLKFFGSWSEPEVCGYFPRSDDCGYELWRTGERVELPTDRLLLLTVGPNVGELGPVRRWRLPLSGTFETKPLWLPAWIDGGALLPQLELVRGLARKAVELSGRRPYDVEDLIFCLAALTRLVREDCEAAPSLWAQPFLFGYSVLSGGRALVEGELCDRYRKIRREYIGERRLKDDQDALRGAVSGMSWQARDLKAIDLRRAVPTKLIFPVSEVMWLVDWTLAAETLVDIVSPFGRLEGAVSRLRGHEVQKIVGQRLVDLCSESDCDVWWLGRERGPLRGSEGWSRDLDAGAVVGAYLVAIEVKALSQRRTDYVEGDPGEVGTRWRNVVLPALKQIDTLADLLAQNPKGRNYEVPSNVEWILPVVCSTVPEWVPGLELEFWIAEGQPRICTLGELQEIFHLLSQGVAPANRIAVTGNR